MQVKAENKRPNWKAWHKWSSKNTLTGTMFHIKSGRGFKDIHLRGTHVNKGVPDDMIPEARLLKIAGEHYMFFVDNSVHGVTKLSRLRGGYYHYIVNPTDKGFTVKRKFYSKWRTKLARAGQVEFYNVMWAVLNDCFYKEAIEGANGGDNSG